MAKCLCELTVKCYLLSSERIHCSNCSLDLLKLCGNLYYGGWRQGGKEGAI